MLFIPFALPSGQANGMLPAAERGAETLTGDRLS